MKLKHYLPLATLESLVSTPITHLAVFCREAEEVQRWASAPQGSCLTAAQAERGSSPMLNSMYLLNPGPPSYITVHRGIVRNRH